MFKARQYLVLFLFMFFLLALLARLFYLQIVGYQKFSGMAAEQHNRVMRIDPRRGALCDSNMEPLAINLDSPSIFADPRNIEDPERTADILSDVLDIDREILLERLKKDKSFAWVKRKVSEEKADRVKALGLKGVHFLNERKRSYPNDNMASHVVGFAGIDNTGLEGVELQYDEKLKGKPGWRYLVKDARRRTVLYNERDSIPPQNGYNIILTIDSVIQFIVEEELRKMVSRYHADSASAIVMDPFSGRVLAMANYPDYDPNSFDEVSTSFIKNTSVSSVFEPGSVFKIVTASAALNEKKFETDDVIYCENGNYRVAGRVLHDFHSYGDLSFREVITKSSNIGTVKVARELGEETVYEYIGKFGFGRKTGIDLPGEVNGISRSPSVWSGSDITTIPIGQGIAVTPIQLVRAISVIANGGYLVTPHVVDRIMTWEGEFYSKYDPPKKAQVLSRDTCKKMKDILRGAVTSGTGRYAQSKFYTTCGKTGTAQMINPKGGYYPNKYVASFIGFAPEERPLVSIVVTAKNPHPVYFGGTVAGPVFKKIAERTLQYLGSGKNE
ncbi:MAG: penicillin-binding transpeptidase domain-containing protein [Candidatus Omnitrophota bacterium]